MIKFLWFLRAKIYTLFGLKIGKKSYIGKPTYIKNFKKIIIGDKVRIYPGSRIEVIGNGRVIINNNVSIGQNIHIISKDNDLIIDENSTISANVLITNVDHEYNVPNLHALSQKLIHKKTIINKNCFIGYGSVLLAGTILGENSVVGALSLLKKKYNSYSVIVGNPANEIKRYNFDNKKWERIIHKNEKRKI